MWHTSSHTTSRRSDHPLGAGAGAGVTPPCEDGLMTLPLPATATDSPWLRTKARESLAPATHALGPRTRSGRTQEADCGSPQVFGVRSPTRQSVLPPPAHQVQPTRPQPNPIERRTPEDSDHWYLNRHHGQQFQQG